MINHNKLIELIIESFKDISNKEDFTNKISNKQLEELSPEEHNFMIKQFEKMYDNSYVFSFKKSNNLYDETEILINFLENKLIHVTIQLFVNESTNIKDKLNEIISILENFSKVDYYYDEANSDKAWRNENGLDFRVVNNFNSINISIVNYISLTENKDNFINNTKNNSFKEADKNFKDINKDMLNSLLLSAINKTHDPDWVEKIINKGADVNFKDNEGRTPIMYAVLNKNNLNIVKILINAGANVNVKDKNGTTPLMGAVSKNNNINIIKTLIDAGANINAKDKNGFTPLKYAKANTNDKKVIELLNSKSQGNSFIEKIKNFFK